MTGKVDPRRLFWIGVLGLFSAAMNTSLRAGVAARIKEQWLAPIDPIHAGEMTGAALGASFLGFSLTLFIASPFLDMIGMRRMLIGAAACLIGGTLLVINAGTLGEGTTLFHLVWFGMMLCGIGWGAVEATINPMTTALYPEDKTSRLNRLHAWWPAGLIVGGLVSAVFGDLDWRILLGLSIVPALIFGFLAAGADFPPTERAASGV